jgi:FdhD protein
VSDRAVPASVTRISSGGAADGQDVVVVEEPLEIRVGDKPLSVTMRTPGDDFDLAAGFLFTEGIGGEIESIRHWGSPNVVRVAMREAVDLQRFQRHFYSTSSCGVCGKTSIEALRVSAPRIESTARVAPEVIHRLPALLREAQKTFEETGAIHAAGLFSLDGTLLRVREDVGRHNAVDKVIGSYIREGRTRLDETILMLSGRAGFEVVQKAVVAGIPIIAAVGAPSSLAVDLSREFDATLLGFVRDGRFNVYAGGGRLLSR